jgi:putative DNA primase/helicase
MSTAGNLQYYAHQLGGNVAGRNRILCPGPGHSRHDRSLAVTFTNDGSFVTHSFAGDDFKDCRDHVKALLGLSDDRPIPVRESPEMDTLK